MTRSCSGGLYSPGGEWFVTSSFGGRARVWDAHTGEVLAELPHGSLVYGVAISADGSLIATGSRDLTARVWEADTGQELARLELESPGYGVAFGADGILAVGTVFDVQLWDWRGGSVETMPGSEGGNSFFGVAFSPDGRNLVAGENRRLLIWNLESREHQEIEIAQEEFQAVHSVRFNSDGSRFLTAHRNGVVVVWDTAGRAAIRTLEGHVGLVWDATFSSDDSLIASASSDGTIRLWDAETGEEVLLLRDTEAFASVDFNQDGRRLLATGGFGARVYVVDEAELFDVAEQRLHRWWLDDECRRFLAVSECPDPPGGLELG